MHKSGKAEGAETSKAFKCAESLKLSQKLNERYFEFSTSSSSEHTRKAFENHPHTRGWKFRD